MQHCTASKMPPACPPATSFLKTSLAISVRQPQHIADFAFSTDGLLHLCEYDLFLIYSRPSSLVRLAEVTSTRQLDCEFGGTAIYRPRSNHSEEPKTIFPPPSRR